MPNLVAELNSLDFKNYIGGPLYAAIQAQHAAAMSIIDENGIRSKYAT